MRNPCLLILLTLLSCWLAAQVDTTDAKDYSLHGTQLRPGPDPYLTELYWQLNNSPMQQRLRRLRPFPVGVVYYQQRDEGYAEAQREFETIRELGFTALKQVLLWDPDNPEGYDERVFHAAIDAGISPWYYGKGGWADITPALLTELDIALDPTPENMPAIQADPRMIAHQHEVWRRRVERMNEKPTPPKGMGEPGRNSPWMPARLIEPFADWLAGQYGTLDSLERAWNCGFIDACGFADFTAAARELQGSDFDVYGNGTQVRTRARAKLPPSRTLRTALSSLSTHAYPCPGSAARSQRPPLQLLRRASLGGSETASTARRAERRLRQRCDGRRRDLSEPFCKRLRAYDARLKHFAFQIPL